MQGAALDRIIESLPCRKRPFGPSNLHRQQSHPGPIPITPHIYPVNPPDTKGQFSMANAPNLHIFGLWEETGTPRGNPHRQNVQTPHSYSWLELNLGPWLCEAAVLTTVPSCHPEHRIPTVQKEAIQLIEPAPTTIPPRPYSCNPTY